MIDTIVFRYFTITPYLVEPDYTPTEFSRKGENGDIRPLWGR